MLTFRQRLSVAKLSVFSFQRAKSQNQKHKFKILSRILFFDQDNGVTMYKKDESEDGGIKNDKNLFYDLRNDPYEQNNLVNTDNQATLAKELREKLAEWDKQTSRLKSVNN